jgi:hypothetical protein
MNCRKARRLLPLAAGGDLPPRKAGRLGSHLNICSGCRSELQSYRFALKSIKVLANREPQPDWTEGEWRSILQIATGRGLKKTRPAVGLFSRRLAWTMSSALVLILAVGSILILRNRMERGIRQPPSPATGAGSKERTSPAEPGPVPLASREFPSPSARPKVEGRLPPETAELPAGHTLRARSSTKQDVVNMVFVSPESGLTIHWVFNSEFEWKEK